MITITTDTLSEKNYVTRSLTLLTKEKIQVNANIEVPETIGIQLVCTEDTSTESYTLTLSKDVPRRYSITGEEIANA